MHKGIVYSRFTESADISFETSRKWEKTRMNAIIELAVDDRGCGLSSMFLLHSCIYIHWAFFFCAFIFDQRTEIRMTSDKAEYKRHMYCTRHFIFTIILMNILCTMFFIPLVILIQKRIFTGKNISFNSLIIRKINRIN